MYGVCPVRLQDLSFSGISKSLTKTYGPIIAYSRVALFYILRQLHYRIIIIYLCTGNKPFVSKAWSDASVHTLKDIYCDNGLKSFQELSAEFSLPGFSFFLYLRLRSALKAYGVPWATNVLPHPLWEWLDFNTPSSGLVSKIIIQSFYCSILIFQLSTPGKGRSSD